MKENLKNILNRIYKIERVFGYISRLESKVSIKGHQYTLVYISNFKDNKEIGCIWCPYDCYDYYRQDFEEKKIKYLYAIYVDLINEHYYRIDWDDVNLGKYNKTHLHEIARTIDDNGNEYPLCLRNYVIYIFYEPDLTLEQFKNNAETDEVEEALSYIEKYEKVHFYIPFKKETQKLLNYRNDYISTKKHRNRTQITICDDDLFEALDPNSCDCNRVLYNDMTDEERVMRDLEEGNGEIHGY